MHAIMRSPYGMIAFWDHFAAKPGPNPQGSQNNQSFGAKMLESPQKTQRNKVLEHWVVWQLKTPTLFCFCFFLAPPAFWHQNLGIFGTLHGFGKVFQYNIAKIQVLAALLLRKSCFRGIYAGSNLVSKVFSNSRNPVSDLTNSMERR